MSKKNLVLTLLMLLITSGFIIKAGAEETPVDLPSDGGEPGKAYMEYCKAMAGGKLDILRNLVTSERAKEMDSPDFAKIFPMIQSMMAKEIKVTGGTMTSKEANLTAEGKDSMTGGVTQGKIHMVLEENQWRVEKDSWSSTLD